MALDPTEQYLRYSGINRLIGKRGQYNVSPDPEFDYLAQMESAMNRAERLRQKALKQSMKNARIDLANQYTPPDRIKFPDITVLPGKGTRGRKGSGRNENYAPGGSPRLRAFIKSIVGQESGGDIKAVSSVGALGKYQIMPANFLGRGGWDVETIGRDVNKRAFLNHERLQDRIAQGKLSDYYRQYGAGGAASAWYSGDPLRQNDYSGVSSGPSVGQYVDEVLSRARRIQRRRRRR